jgi:hypothetical protein
MKLLTLIILLCLNSLGWASLRNDVVNQGWTHTGTNCTGDDGFILGGPPTLTSEADFLALPEDAQNYLLALATQQDNVAAGIEFCKDHASLNFAIQTQIGSASIGGAWHSDQDNNISTCRLVTTGPAGRVTLNGVQTAGQIVCNSNY